MAITIPSARYVSDEFAEREQTLLWPGVWQLACSLDHVANAGDYHEYRIGYRSVLVVRGDDGDFRAFQNACRHRGSVICEGTGIGLSETPLPVPPLDVRPRRAGSGRCRRGVSSGSPTMICRSFRCASRRGARSSSSTSRSTRNRWPNSSARSRTTAPGRASTSSGAPRPSRLLRRATGRRSSTASARRTTCRAFTARCCRCATT